MLRRSVLLVGIALGACRIVALSEPLGAADESPAILAISVGVVDTPGLSYVQLKASFRPGRDERGEPRRVLADSLVVFGVALAPEPTGADTLLSFSATWPVAAAIAGSAEPLVLPATDGLRPPPLADDTLLVWTTAPDTLLVGEQLVLPLRRGPLTREDDASTLWWTLDVATAQRRDVNIEGTGAPPDTIRMPRSLLPDVADARLRLQVSRLSEYKLLGGDYRVRMAQYTNIIRVLRFTDPAP